VKKVLSLFESQPFDLALLTVAASIASIYGLNIPVQTILIVISPIMVAIGATGWTQGKQTEQDTAIKLHLLAHGTAPEHLNSTFAKLKASKAIPLAAAPKADAGFVKRPLLMPIMFLCAAILVGVGGAQTGCTKGQIINAGQCVLDTGVLTDVLAALASDNYAQLISQLETKDGAALIACALEAAAGGNTVPSDAGSATPPIAARARELLAKRGGAK
jgi:hypothetical protein